MSLQSAGTVLCEPTRLYNILTQVKQLKMLNAIPVSLAVCVWMFQYLCLSETVWQVSSSGGRKLSPAFRYTQHQVFSSIWTQCIGIYADTRSSEDYNEGHIQLAKLARKSDDSSYRVPFGAHLPTCLHCIVYDSKTVSVIEDSECKLNTHTLTRTHTLVCYCSSSYSTGKSVGS